MRSKRKLEEARRRFDAQPWVQELVTGAKPETKEPTPSPPEVDAMSLDHASYVARLNSLGIGGASGDLHAAPPEHRLQPPRQPLDPGVRARIEYERTEAVRRRTEYIGGLPKFDARSATPEQVADRLRAFGLESYPSDFRERLPEPTADERKADTRPEDRRREREERARSRIVNMALTARQTGRGMDARSMSGVEFAQFLRLRGFDPGA